MFLDDATTRTPRQRWRSTRNIKTSLHCETDTGTFSSACKDEDGVYLSLTAGSYRTVELTDEGRSCSCILLFFGD